MALLEIAQIIFYFSASLLIILALFALGFVTYEAVTLVKAIKSFVKKAKAESSLLYQKLDNALGMLTKLSFFSHFFKGRKKENNNKE